MLTVDVKPANILSWLNNGMTSLKDRLEEVMKAMSWEHADLMRASGQSSSVVSQWLGKGSKEIKTIGKMEAAMAIQAASGFAALWVAKGEGPKHITVAKAHWTEDNDQMGPGLATAPSIKGTVPLISEVQAGHWKEAIDNLHPGEGERIPTTYKARAHTYALRVTNDSMEPRISEGAIIIVEPEESPVPGKIVVVRRGDGKATLKQLVQDGDTLFLKPINPRYPIMEITQDTVFCGVVKRVEFDV